LTENSAKITPLPLAPPCSETSVIRSNIKRGGNGNRGLPGPNNSPRAQAIRSSYSKLARRSFMSVSLSRPRPAATDLLRRSSRASNTRIGQPEAAAAPCALGFEGPQFLLVGALILPRLRHLLGSYSRPPGWYFSAPGVFCHFATHAGPGRFHSLRRRDRGGLGMPRPSLFAAQESCEATIGKRLHEIPVRH